MRVALVLGAAVWPGGAPSPSLRLRVDHAIDLWRRGEVSVICVSGGVGRHGPAEGEVGCALARAAGVPPEALVAETQSRNTVENIALSAELLDRAPVVIVSNRWHLPRAILVAWILGLSARPSGPVGRLSRIKTARAILREAVAIPATALRAIRWARRNGR